MLASLYLTGFELLADSVVDRIRRFFQVGGSLNDDRYRSEMDLGGHGWLENSCRWLVNVSAISPQDAEQIDSIRQKRNRIAHELPTILVGEQEMVTVKDLARLRDLLVQVETWWILNVEIPTDPDFHPDSFTDAADIRTGYTVLFDYLLAQAADL